MERSERHRLAKEGHSSGAAGEAVRGGDGGESRASPAGLQPPSAGSAPLWGRFGWRCGQSKIGGEDWRKKGKQTTAQNPKPQTKLGGVNQEGGRSVYREVGAKNVLAPLTGSGHPVSSLPTTSLLALVWAFPLAKLLAVFLSSRIT